MTSTRAAVPRPRGKEGDDLPAFGFAQLLDAMPDAAAVLDATGTIVAVNRTWRSFSEDNGGRPEDTGVGANYLEVCARSAAAGCDDAAAVEAGIRTVLQGRTMDSVLDYSCPSPALERWFALRVTPIGGMPPGALVSHTNITRQKKAELDLLRQASQDPLTGLANRSRLDKRLRSALTARRGREPRADVGLLYLDLDRFKPVNDTYGHAAGDELLQEVGSRLRRLVRPQDTVARIGGDEFCLVVTRTTPERMAAMAGRVEQALREPHLIHGRLVVVGVSVGWCLAMPGESPAEVLNRADQAMYDVKRAALTTLAPLADDE